MAPVDENRVATGKREIDQLIEDVTLDCYNDDEERTAFLVAFHEHLTREPVSATIVGFGTELIGVDDGGDRRGLVADVRHSGGVHTMALHDVMLTPGADTDLAGLQQAYCEWCRR